MIKKVYIFVIAVLFLGAMNLSVLAQTQNPSSAKPSVSAPSVKSTPAKKLSVQKKTGPVIRKYQKPITPTNKPITPPAKTKTSTQPTKPIQPKPSVK